MSTSAHNCLEPEFKFQKKGRYRTFPEGAGDCSKAYIFLEGRDSESDHRNDECRRVRYKLLEVKSKT